MVAFRLLQIFVFGIMVCGHIFQLAIFDPESPCVTPTGEEAQCIPARSCPMIIYAILSKDPIKIAAVKAHSCGFDGARNPLVCCGKSLTYENVPNPHLPSADECGIQFRDDRIIHGGIKAKILDFPWMALLGYTDENKKDAGFKCGGTLISKRYVLTAAHCIVGSIAREFNMSYVRLSEHDTNSPKDCYNEFDNDTCVSARDIQIEDVIVHKEFSFRTGNNDIALIRLSEEVAFEETIQPICLPNHYVYPPSEGLKMTTCGWGVTEHGQVSNVKLKVEVPIVNQEFCKSKFNRTLTVITSNQICAGGEKGKDSCKGDSGGPLMHHIVRETEGGFVQHWYQEGVVSRGIGCGLENYPGIYTRVAKYLKWIAQNTRS